MTSQSLWVRCVIFSSHFGLKVFVIRLLCRTFKEKWKIQGHHPVKLGFGFTTTYIMIVIKYYEILYELKQE